MSGKLIIKCQIKVLTGLHIGDSGVFSPIGAVDSPVVADPMTHRPILPGSSLKGKLRSLLVRSLCEKPCKVENDPAQIKRLFGAHSPAIVPARLQFADAFVSNADDFRGIGLTEIKFENTIDRMTSRANPRQIERVVPGVEFACRIAYTLEGGTDEIKEDLKLLAKGMRLLQLDYLGGHGTRGSGRVSFKKILLEPVECSLSEECRREIEAMFKEVEAYELFAV